jgi:hypothetical protein
VTRVVRNAGASVRERLLNHARESQQEFGVVLRRYFMERFLYRLGESASVNRFVLKGAMLLQLWADQPYRATGDLDLLRRGDADDEALIADLRELLALPVEPDDGVVFDVASLTIEPIRRENAYGGRRVHFVASLARARERLQVDLGIGDAIWPRPRKLEYPTLLDSAPPSILTYPRETVIAEKLQAMVVLGPRNSRIRDFYDVHYLASTFSFEGEVISEAVRRTFARRRTPVPSTLPVGLTTEYWDESGREAQIRAFGRRAKLDTDVLQAKSMLPRLESFLWPLLQHLAADEKFVAHWPIGGPWTTKPERWRLAG